ncbi:MAG: hypothetical protein ABI222_08955 [Opitutaceae bacterium]
MRETLVLLALAWLIPFLVHLIPWSAPRPLGAYLLPMFWATFVAVYFYGAAVGLLTGLFAPAMNLLLTGLPAARVLGGMSLELVVFVVAMAWAVRHAPRCWLLAPLGYFLARTVTVLVLSPGEILTHADAAGHFFTHLVVGGAAGLVILAIINAALVKFYPKSAELVV